MSRKEISGQGRAFHSFTARELRIRRNFVSISVLQRCPILDTEGRGRERCLRWTNTHVYRRCRNVQLFGRVLNARRHTSNANTRIAHYTPAAPIVLLPPVRSSSPLLPPPLQPSQTDDIRFPLNNFHNGTWVVSYITQTPPGEIYFK